VAGAKQNKVAELKAKLVKTVRKVEAVQMLGKVSDAKKQADKEAEAKKVEEELAKAKLEAETKHEALKAALKTAVLAKLGEVSEEQKKKAVQDAENQLDDELKKNKIKVEEELAELDFKNDIKEHQSTQDETDTNAIAEVENKAETIITAVLDNVETDETVQNENDISVGNEAKGMLDNVMDNVKTGTDTALEVSGGVVQEGLDGASQAMNNLGQGTTKAVNSLKTESQKMANDLAEGTGKVADKIANGAGEVVNKGMDTANQALGGLAKESMKMVDNLTGNHKKDNHKCWKRLMRVIRRLAARMS